MTTLKINLQRDEPTFKNEGKVIYIVRKPEGQPTGSLNAFNIVIEGPQALRVSQMLNIEAVTYAYPSARAKSGYIFKQF